MPAFWAAQHTTMCLDFQKNTEKHKLMITDQKNSSSEISHGVVIQRHDIAVAHEETDNISAQQGMQVAAIE